MDKVQFQLEATLPELKDLYEKGLFTKSEINQITKRRTALETALIRRVSRKEDFFKYAEYEINLERLRKVRWKKLKYHLNPPPPSASTYSLPRRALYILKRATVKFPGDLAVWLAYVEYASREGMRKVVGKGLTNALQHHPTSSTLYLLQTYYHLHPGSAFPRSAIPSTSKLDLPSASSSDEETPAFSIEGITPARTTLLLGLRLLPQSRDLWREYIKLELGWVEALRRRWKVLGLKDGLDVAAPTAEDYDGDVEALVGGEGAFGPEGEDARKAILTGQLVVHALTSALEAIPSNTTRTETEGDGMTFREELLQLFRHYPSPLRTKCLGVMYDDLDIIAKGNDTMAARAKLLSLTRNLYDRTYQEEVEEDQGQVVLEGVGLVEEMGRIGKEIRKSAKGGQGTAWLEVAGEWLVDQIDDCADNEQLGEYLTSILSSLTKPSLNPPASLLLNHLNLVNGSPSLLTTARSYASIHPSNPSIQRVRLEAEIAVSSDSEVTRKLCEEVARAVTQSGLSEEDKDEVERIWQLWSDWEDTRNSIDPTELESRWKYLLRQTQRFGSSIPELHGNMLSRYIISMRDLAGRRIPQTVKQVCSIYKPTWTTFFVVFFDLITADLNGATNGLTAEEMKSYMDSWRAVCSTKRERADVATSHVEWLLLRGKGREAFDVKETCRREVGDDDEALEHLESTWKKLIDEAEERKREAESDDENADEDEEMDEA
ncbi:hypothetical protein CI109_100624 [Kwoniella shandongensis]|uniref:U3 small nucleolar RNA-associated protein 6 N-terminal domain-containing protein n=1 Tax=Kwoniella shandongensis TaxID=1734106 RepID=A0A5M6BZ93_9TREE|nr:uncharacterized protein CI109_003454 [Kwoniella shandongensis]KAA5528166.1 hypothetical protein CI109_003454 [Kwoniella shandongensis]